MSRKIELNYEKYYNDLIFAEKDPKKKHANDFINLFVDLIIESCNSKFPLDSGKDENN